MIRALWWRSTPSPAKSFGTRLRIEPGTYSASPTLADGKIYATSEDGTTSVLEAGKEFKVLAVNKFDSHTLASPAAAGNQLFIRTAEHLYCLAGQ